MKSHRAIAADPPRYNQPELFAAVSQLVNIWAKPQEIDEYPRERKAWRRRLRGEDPNLYKKLNSAPDDAGGGRP